MTLVTIKHFFHQRFDHWLKRKIPASSHQTLSRRNIFIMPTRFGFAYLFFVFLLFILGTNYQNNIIMLLSYLLASLFITVMMHSFYNFSNLSFKSIPIQTGFAKQIIIFPIKITAKKKHFDLTFSFFNKVNNTNNHDNKVHITQCESGVTKIELPCYCDKRGVHILGRVKILSEYSLGLFVTWTQLDFGHKAIVFPKPKEMHTNYRQSFNVAEGESTKLNELLMLAGSDDFSELKSHLPGESLSRIAWKQVAKGQGKYSKQYQSQKSNVLWLMLADMPSSELETQLQLLTFLIIEYSRTNQIFGMKLNSHSIEPASGQTHQLKCLTALAYYA